MAPLTAAAMTMIQAIMVIENGDSPKMAHAVNAFCIIIEPYVGEDMPDVEVST